MDDIFPFYVQQLEENNMQFTPINNVINLNIKRWGWKHQSKCLKICKFENGVNNPYNDVLVVRSCKSVGIQREMLNFKLPNLNTISYDL